MCYRVFADFSYECVHTTEGAGSRARRTAIGGLVRPRGCWEICESVVSRIGITCHISVSRGIHGNCASLIYAVAPEETRIDNVVAGSI